MSKNKILLFILACVCLAGLPLATQAGGPLMMFDTTNRIPFRYKRPPQVYSDLGALGIISNERADKLVETAVYEWSNVPTSSFRADYAGDFSLIGLPDITATNAMLVIGANNGGGIHVIYDNDGFIIQNVLGASRTSTLGVATPEFAFANGDGILESWVVINGFAVNAADSQGVRYGGVVTHEFGHSINLAHSQTNGSVISFAEGPGPGNCSPLPYSTTSFVSDTETMFPFLNVGTTIASSGAAMATVDRLDDRAALSDLYPGANWPAVAGSVSGKLRLNNGVEAGNYNVVARNINNPFGDANSARSGDRTLGAIGPDGSFRINGLTPGAQYVVYIDAIFRGGFPGGLPFMAGPEEFFNGPNEGGNGETDPPCAYTPLTMTAGVNQDTSMTFNRIPGAPQFDQIGIGLLGSGITDDGNTVVGNSISGPPSFRWTPAGIENLGGTGGSQTTISGDGSLITGGFIPVPSPSPALEFASRWVSGTTWEPLPAAPGNVPCAPSGSTNWGTSRNGASGLTYIGGCTGPRAFFWNRTTNTTTVMAIPSPITGNAQARTNNMSDDGRTLAGWIVCAGNPMCRGGRQGVAWDSVTGQFFDFSTAFGASVGEAYNANSDGSAVVGLNAGTNRLAWLWRHGEGFTLLPNLPVPSGNPSGSALDVSDDGNVVVGATSVSLTNFFVPSIWTPETGNLNLDTFVQAMGTDLAQWTTLRSPLALTPDGTTMTGLGNGPPGTNFGAYRLKISTAIVCFNSSTGPRTLRVGFPQPFRQYMEHGATVGFCPTTSNLEEDPGFFTLKQ